MDPNQQQPQSQPEVPQQTPTAMPPNPAPQPQPAPAYNEDPGKTLGIISFIMPFVSLGVVGLILGIIARKKSKAAGFNNGLALAGIILSIISIVVALIFIVVAILATVNMAQKCRELGPGTHYVGSTKYECGTSSSSSY